MLRGRYTLDLLQLPTECSIPLFYIDIYFFWADFVAFEVYFLL
jgi:hypothetical protein